MSIQIRYVEVNHKLKLKKKISAVGDDTNSAYQVLCPFRLITELVSIRQKHNHLSLLLVVYISKKAHGSQSPHSLLTKAKINKSVSACTRYQFDSVLAAARFI